MSMLGGSGVGMDTLLGVGLGAAAVWYLWTSWADEPALPPGNRKFSPDDLSLYDGQDNRLCFVAVGEEVFDVSKDKTRFKANGGKPLPAGFPGDEAAFRREYRKVGSLVVPRDFTKEQLAAFDGRDGRPVYICAKGVVYDVDPGFYGPDGPYGMMAGRDASRALARMSLDPADVENSDISDLSASERSQLEEYVAKFEMKYHRVGFLVGSGSSSTTSARATAPGAAASKPMAPVTGSSSATFLTKDRQQVELAEKVELSPDTRLFRFRLPHPEMRLGLPIGKHVKFWCPNPTPVKDGEWNGNPDPEAGKKEIERKYTPSSLDIEKSGEFDVVIKVYAGATIERFPDGGKMSQYLNTLRVGDMIDVAGPFGLIEYKGMGTFNIRRKDRKVKFVGMLAGGTGITPMLQIIKAVLRDPSDDTKMSLIFANQTENDILVRDMLESEAQKHPERFKLHYTLDRPPTEWAYSEGFIDADMIKAHMPPPSSETVIFMCGPPPMIKFACKANLDTLGYPKDAQIEF